MYDGESEYRLNTFKNFHSFNKGAWMDYGTYNQRVNTEVTRMNNDMYDGEEEIEEEPEEEIDLTGVDQENNYQDRNYDSGLVIGGNDGAIQRAHSYPADFQVTSNTSTQRTKGLAAKTGRRASILTYENFLNCL